MAMDDRPDTRDANVDVLNDQADAADDDADPADVIDGTTLKRTSDGEPLEARLVHGRTIELRGDGGIGTQLTPGDLLDRLKAGDYYLPTHPSGFQDALRRLRDA